MTAPQALEYAALALTVVAVWLIGGLSVRGQWIMLASQIVWLAVAVLQSMWGLAAQSAVLSGLTVRAVVRWRRAQGRWW